MVSNRLQLLSYKKYALLSELNKILVTHNYALVSKRCITRVLKDTKKDFYKKKTDFLGSRTIDMQTTFFLRKNFSTLLDARVMQFWGI
jgi:hypothetical protein